LIGYVVREKLTGVRDEMPRLQEADNRQETHRIPARQTTWRNPTAQGRCRVRGVCGEEEMKTLFTMPEQSKHAGTGHVCGECFHAVRPHHYRQDWLYCEITPSNITQFGIAKIKTRQPACQRFAGKENKK